MPSALCPQRQEGWRLDILGGRCCRRGCCGLHTPKLSPIGWTCPAAALPHSLDQTNIPPGLTGCSQDRGGGLLPATILLSLERLSPSLPAQHWAQPGLGLASGHHSPQPPHSGTASSLRVADPLQPMRPAPARPWPCLLGNLSSTSVFLS